MEVYLIRHTETVAPKGVCYGQSDVALKEPYRFEFDNIVNQLDLGDPIIFSSPLTRCVLLANYIYSASNCQSPLIIDPRLKELNFGQWEMKKWDEIAKAPLDIWMDDFVNEATPNGESFLQLHDRIRSFISESLITLDKSQQVIIVAHAGVVRSFLCHFRNINLRDAFNITVDFGEVFKFEL